MSLAHQPSRPKKRRYESNAERQRAYRQRKAAQKPVTLTTEMLKSLLAEIDAERRAD